MAGNEGSFGREDKAPGNPGSGPVPRDQSATAIKTAAQRPFAATAVWSALPAARRSIGRHALLEGVQLTLQAELFLAQSGVLRLELLDGLDEQRDRERIVDALVALAVGGDQLGSDGFDLLGDDADLAVVREVLLRELVVAPFVADALELRDGVERMRDR